MTVKLTPPQRQVRDHPARFRVAICGRRFGKSYLAVTECLKNIAKPNKIVAFVSPTYAQAKRTIWPLFKSILFDLQWKVVANNTDMSLKFENGSIIYLLSSHNYEMLRGIGLDFVVLDEFALIDDKAWYQVIRPALSDREGGALLISTPRGLGNFAYDMFNNESMDTEWKSFHFTTLQGGQVSEDEIESAKRSLDEKSFQQEYEASFDVLSGKIYYNFTNFDNIISNYQPSSLQEILVGADFNVGKMCSIIAVQTKDRIIVIDEIVLTDANTPLMIKTIKEKYPNSKITVFPDASGNNRHTSSTHSDHVLLKQAGFTVKANRANPYVRDRIASVNAAFEDVNGHRTLFIDSNCKELIKCLNNHTYKEGTTEPDKDSGYDHMNDALGYLIHTIRPIRAKGNIEALINRFGPGIGANI